jgi:hypothetical protein
MKLRNVTRDSETVCRIAGQGSVPSEDGTRSQLAKNPVQGLQGNQMIYSQPTKTQSVKRFTEQYFDRTADRLSPNGLPGQDKFMAYK